jgi:hypothetical protein
VARSAFEPDEIRDVVSRVGAPIADRFRRARQRLRTHLTRPFLVNIDVEDSTKYVSFTNSTSPLPLGTQFAPGAKAAVAAAASMRVFTSAVSGGKVLTITEAARWVASSNEPPMQSLRDRYQAAYSCDSRPSPDELAAALGGDVLEAVIAAIHPPTGTGALAGIKVATGAYKINRDSGVSRHGTGPMARISVAVFPGVGKIIDDHDAHDEMRRFLLQGLALEAPPGRARSRGTKTYVIILWP